MVMVTVIGNDELDDELVEWLDGVTHILKHEQIQEIEDDDHKQLHDVIAIQGLDVDHSDKVDRILLDTIELVEDEVDDMVELEDMVVLLQKYVVDSDDEVEADIHELRLLKHIIQLHNALLRFHI